MPLKTLLAGPHIIVGVQYPSSWTDEQYEEYLERLAESLDLQREDIRDS